MKYSHVIQNLFQYLHHHQNLQGSRPHSSQNHHHIYDIAPNKIMKKSHTSNYDLPLHILKISCNVETCY
jgi:hypothetical protein